MVKKTFYTKEELAEQKNNPIELKSVEKDPPQIKNIKNDKEQTDIEKELTMDAISQKKPKKTIAIKRKARSSLMDEHGNKLKKDGTIDKRGETGLNNLKKSRVYQQILENKKLKEKEGKVAVLTPYVDSSDSEAEFETKDIKLELEPEPEPAPAPATGVASGGVSKGTDDFIKKQEAEREKMLADQLKAMELENKKLKDSFHYNTHLNRMQSLATNVKLKF
jgi:hypothetical protein